MRWMQTEYLLKGVFLGLLADIALKQAGQPEFDWQAPLLLALYTFGGLFLALAVSGLNKLRQGYRVSGRFLPFVLFLLLESPTLVYAGILVGAAVGAYLIRPGDPDDMLIYMVLGGVALGLLFGTLRQLKDRRTRLGLSLLMGAGLVAGALYAFGQLGDNPNPYDIRKPVVLGLYLLIGLPIFYLLTFAGQEEESEIEVGAMCGTLGLGLALVLQDSQFRAAAFLLPIVLYAWYTLKVLPHLRVFKYVLRGMSHAAVGRHAPALLALRRALSLNPTHELAREEYWKVHISLDFNDLERNPELLALVDFQLCVDRAGMLLLTQPTARKLADAHRLLDLVISQRPRFRPAVDYWRAVAFTHEGRLNEAITLLEHLVDPSPHHPNDPYRQSVLLNAWQLALTLHPVLTERVGQPQIVLPGRRMEAIVAAERHLAENGRDAGVEQLKKLLYQDLTMEEFKAACPDGDIPTSFDYVYCQQIGSALLGQPDHWERGVVFLRIAARGLPAISPTLFSLIAQAYEKAGRPDEMWHFYDVAKKAGVAVGHKALAEQDRHNFFRVVKALGDNAMAKGEVDAAIADFSLYSEYERSGIETLRTLAELYAQKQDALAALRITDRALQYNSADRDLLQKKDSYYFSVSPELLQANHEIAVRELDFDYCIKKAKSLLENPDVAFDVIDWADHLATIALVVRPESRPAKVVKARVHWRRGEIEQAVGILEQVRSPKPEKFLGADDEEAWYVSSQLLADLYLNNLGKPDLAIACLNDFRNSPRSGAKTLYRLGQAYEALGDRARAAKFYEQVTAYESNPLAPEAHDALARLRSG